VFFFFLRAGAAENRQAISSAVKPQTRTPPLFFSPPSSVSPPPLSQIGALGAQGPLLFFFYSFCFWLFPATCLRMARGRRLPGLFFPFFFSPSMSQFFFFFPLFSRARGGMRGRRKAHASTRPVCSPSFFLDCRFPFPFFSGRGPAYQPWQEEKRAPHSRQDEWPVFPPPPFLSPFFFFFFSLLLAAKKTGRPDSRFAIRCPSKLAPSFFPFFPPLDFSPFSPSRATLKAKGAHRRRNFVPPLFPPPFFFSLYRPTTHCASSVDRGKW